MLTQGAPERSVESINIQRIGRDVEGEMTQAVLVTNTKRCWQTILMTSHSFTPARLPETMHSRASSLRSSVPA